MNENLIAARNASLYEPNNVYRVYQYRNHFFITCNESARPENGLLIAVFRHGQSITPNDASA